MNKTTLAFVTFCFLCATCFAETEVGGIINSSQRWTPDNNPYILTQDVLVSKGASLVIDAGTVILAQKATVRNVEIKQTDALDSGNNSLIIEGSLECMGTLKNKISFLPQDPQTKEPAWYGIVLRSSSARIGHTLIRGAYNAITITAASPIIHHCVMDYNNVGIVCQNRGDAAIVNCVIVHNYLAGIRYTGSNPLIENSIVAFNNGNGVWGDGTSRFVFRYNCVFGNTDGNFMDCDPELGILKKKNSRKDSTDAFGNVIKNPIFAGSVYDSLAVEKDVTLPTDKSRVKDTTIAKMMHGELTDSLAHKKRKKTYPPYSPSSYSPCVNSGNPARKYNDENGSAADMGIYGSQGYSGAEK